jgi:hypothetical protein
MRPWNAMTAMTDALICWNCGASLDEVLLPVSRHEYCPQCAEAVHCCRMCVHYSATAVEQCREDRAEPPTAKESANFCDFFSPQLRGDASGELAGDSGTAARSRLDALFGEDPAAPAASAGQDSSKPHSSKQDETRSRLDALFGGDNEDDRKGT